MDKVQKSSDPENVDGLHIFWLSPKVVTAKITQPMARTVRQVDKT
jgi:hypothetical protein